MSDIEISIPFVKFSSTNNNNNNNRKIITVNNNNNNNSDGSYKSVVNIDKEIFLKVNTVSSIRLMTANGESMTMSPESIVQRSTIERHSPYQNGSMQSPQQSTNSLSPSSIASPRTMSPPSEHRSAINYSNDGYQPNYIGSIASYQTSVPPKKSFCIDALLSKNNQNPIKSGQHSPETIRYLNDDDMSHKYNDDNREYTSSPDEMNSR